MKDVNIDATHVVEIIVKNEKVYVKDVDGEVYELEYYAKNHRREV